MLDLPAGPAFVAALERVWATGDAVFPLDPRLPDAERRRVVAAMAPGAIIDADGQRRALSGGRPVEPGDAIVVATSGTTGLPKGVVLTHDAVVASAWATTAAIGADPSRDRWLACLPPAHVGGLSVITRALITGTALEVHPGFDPSAVRRAVEGGVTLISLVTRALAQIRADWFTTIVLGGAAPPPDRPANVVATYGLTETGSGVVYDRTPIDGVAVRVDEDGEIWLRGPMLLRAYRDGTDPKVDGWLPTGDLGSLRADGSLQVDGRRGEVIVTGGEKVWPTRGEEVIARRTNLTEVALVGRPHPEWGHEVVALAVAPTEGTAPSLAEVRAAVREELPVWYAPRALEWVAALPRTSLGKLRRDQIQATDRL